jgi:putative transposase
MARHKEFNFRTPLVKMFSPKMIRTASRETGAVIRERKINIVDFFWTLVLGFGAGKERTISGMRRMYEQCSGKKVEESSFYNRFNAGLVKLLKQLTAQSIDGLCGAGRALQGQLSAFSDLILTDSTIMQLHDSLETHYPGVRTNHSPASLKVHAVMSVIGKGKSSVKITPGKRHDGPVFTVGKWVRNKLLLFDLGYYRFQLFSCIRRNKGFFISRLKSFSDLKIIENNQLCRGRAIDLVGQNVQTVAESLKRESFDVMVQADVRKRSYAGRSRKSVQQFRVVGVLNEHDQCYQIFITNVPVEMLSAKQIAQTYAARWEVELLFKELKNNYRMDNLPSRKKHVVEALVYAAILTLIESRKILQQLRIQRSIPQERLPRLRWATLLESVATLLLLVMIRPPSQTDQLASLITSMLIHEAPDPNKSRTGLLNRVENGTHEYERRLR